jgi:ferredoxin
MLSHEKLREKERMNMTNSGGYGGGGAGKGGGMGRGMGRGRGGDRGRRRGMGQGRGAGQGIGGGQGAIPPYDSAPYSESYDAPQGPEALRVLEKEMRAQLRAVNKRIAEFEGTERVPSVSTGEQSKYSPEKERDFVKMTAVVDEERCIRCEFCVDICPEEAITMNGPAVIDFNKCTACGSCINECPNEAISLSEMTKRNAS